MSIELKPESDRSTRPASRPLLLNLGCGVRFHPDWTNLDLNPASPSVRRHDVTSRLPFADATFDAVYHAHLLEHLPCSVVPGFLHECRRALRPGGVLRLVVPDLEQIARLYLDAAQAAWQDDTEASRRRDWLVMELLDQTVREQGGGAMLDYLARDGHALAWYRLGADGAVIRHHLLASGGRKPPEGSAGRISGGLRPPLAWTRLFRGWRERLIRWLLGSEYAALQVGRFRRGGEVHHWMYDRVSLRELLGKAGFVDFRCVSADESAIPGWACFHLDTRPDGSVAKPDSLYVEASRP